jgi:Carboxypeptidase regulatory-like domain/TonB-dependent Receptor Plug Domain
VNLRSAVISPLIPRIKLFLLLVLCTAFRAWAQFGAATVVGVVQDSSKAGITDAKLKLINTQTGTENDSATNQAGGFLLPGVIPGAYTLQIERDGFATTQVNGIELDAGDDKNLLIRMKVGAVTETVNVDASELTLNRSNASVSTVVDRKLIAKVPLNGRSLQDLISLTPGIVTESPQAATQSGTQTQGDFSVNGEPTEANSFFVDGVSANIRSVLTSSASHTGSSGSIAGSTALGTTQSLISVDALQEFRVLSSTYSAEYGRTPGGQFTFLTRSGGNDVHGSLYDYFRSNPLDTLDWFAKNSLEIDKYPIFTGYTPAVYKQSDFGGTLGAPIVVPSIYDGRNRSFLFLSYEGLYVDQQTPQTYSLVPTFCYGNSGPECPGIPLEVAAVLQTFPFPLYTTPAPVLGFAKVTGASFPSHVNSSSVRVDHIFSPKFSIFVRYGGTPSDGSANQLYSVTTYRNSTQSLTFGATNQLSASQSNELRLGYVGAHVNSSTTTEVLDYGSGHTGIFPGGDLNADLGAVSSYGSASADAYIHITGLGDSDSNTNQARDSLDEWNLRDTFSLSARNHLFRFGVDQRYIRAGMTPPAVSILADFFTRDSLVENSASDLVVTRSTPARPVLDEFSAFTEDEWKIWPSLSLSLGLRWDVNPAPKGQHGQDAYTVLGDIAAPATLRLAPRGTSLWHTGWFNLAPRLGAAWVVRGQPGRELLVRAGGGVFFDTGTRAALRAFDGIGFATSAYFLGAPVPATSSQIAFPTAVTAPYSNMQAFAFSPHLQLPYSWQWNLGVEQALGRNQSITVSYVGAAGRRLLEEQRRNVSAANPDFGDVTYFPSGLNSSFQSLQTKFQRSWSPGIEVLASYTWAHSLDYGSTDPAYPLQWGNSNLDVRQNLEAAASWSSAPARHRLLSFRRALEGWEADGRLIARTSFPVDLLGNFFFDPVTGRPYYSGVDLVPGKPFYLHDSQLPGGRMFNGGQTVSDPAFVLPAGAAQGDAPRNFVRGFPAVQGNLAVQQSIRLPERLNVQIKAETFNVFNHPNFGYIDPSLSDLLFGQSTKMLNQSFGSSGALYNQGGPRAIQLSLRLTF